uniref:Uncharacterized protein n=1 Tax=Amphimedon queenslandica TaxID=400682 RepID=A0A1X7VGD4_AMPQE
MWIYLVSKSQVAFCHQYDKYGSTSHPSIGDNVLVFANVAGGPPPVDGGPPPLAGGLPPVAGGLPRVAGGPPPVDGGPPLLARGLPPVAGGPPLVAGGLPPVAGGPPPLAGGLRHIPLLLQHSIQLELLLMLLLCKGRGSSSYGSYAKSIEKFTTIFREAGQEAGAGAGGAATH